MTNEIYGELCGKIINDSYFIGTFINFNILGDLKQIQLKKNYFNGNVEGCDILGNISGDYICMTETNMTKGTLTTEIKGKIVNINCSSQIYNIIPVINDEFKKLNISCELNYDNNIFYIISNDITEEITFYNSYYKKVINSNVYISMTKDLLYFEFNIFDNNNCVYNIYIPYEGSISLSIAGMLYNTNLTPEEVKTNEIFNLVNDELNMIKKDLYKRKPINIEPKQINNNLFTPFTLYAKTNLRHFNNYFGEQLGIINNIDINNMLNNKVMFVYGNNNLNTSNGSQNYNNFVVYSDNADTQINNKIYNFEKYNKYRVKLDINNKTNEERINLIKLYSKSYNLYVLSENGNIYGIYII